MIGSIGRNKPANAARGHQLPDATAATIPTTATPIASAHMMTLIPVGGVVDGVPFMVRILTSGRSTDQG